MDRLFLRPCDHESPPLIKVSLYLISRSITQGRMAGVISLLGIMLVVEATEKR